MIPSPSSYHIEIWNHLILIKNLKWSQNKRFIYLWKNSKQFLWYELLLIKYQRTSKSVAFYNVILSMIVYTNFNILFGGKFYIHLYIYILVLTLYHQYKVSTFIHKFYQKKDKTTPKFSLDVLISTLSTFCSKYVTGSQEYQFFLCIKRSPAFPCISKNYPA